MTEPLRITFDVAAAPERTFELWTAPSTWWPATHTVSAQPASRSSSNPASAAASTSAPLKATSTTGARSPAVSRPTITYLWHLHQDRADATAVEITFTADERKGTAVAIEHRGSERLGAHGPERRQQNQHGWAGVLPHFQAAAANTIPR